MLARAAFRSSITTSFVTRRSFQSTRTQLSSPYHYPEGPRSNIPFNPLTKWFALRYWGFMGNQEPQSFEDIMLISQATGFGLPFGVAVWQLKKNQ